MTVGIARTDLDAAGLRLAAGRCRDAAAARRMLALALVLEGWNRTDAARAAGMDRQTLRDWVHRYNASGLAGLSNHRRAGAPVRKLTVAQEALVGEWVRAGPSLAERNLVRWRCIDLRDEISRHFGVDMHERTVGKLLVRLSFSKISVRPRHPAQDAAAGEAHKKTSPNWSPRPSLNTPKASPLNSGGKMKRASASKEA